MTNQKDPPETVVVSPSAREVDRNSLFRNANGTWTISAIALAIFGGVAIFFMMY